MRIPFHNVVCDHRTRKGERLVERKAVTDRYRNFSVWEYYFSHVSNQAVFAFLSRKTRWQADILFMRFNNIILS